MFNFSIFTKQRHSNGQSEAGKSEMTNEHMRLQPQSAAWLEANRNFLAYILKYWKSCISSHYSIHSHLYLSSCWNCIVVTTRCKARSEAKVAEPHQALYLSLEERTCLSVEVRGSQGNVENFKHLTVWVAGNGRAQLMPSKKTMLTDSPLN